MWQPPVMVTSCDVWHFVEILCGLPLRSVEFRDTVAEMVAERARASCCTASQGHNSKLTNTGFVVDSGKSSLPSTSCTKENVRLMQNKFTSSSEKSTFQAARQNFIY